MLNPSFIYSFLISFLKRGWILSYKYLCKRGKHWKMNCMSSAQPFRFHGEHPRAFVCMAATNTSPDCLPNPPVSSPSFPHVLHAVSRQPRLRLRPTGMRLRQKRKIASAFGAERLTRLTRPNQPFLLSCDQPPHPASNCSKDHRSAGFCSDKQQNIILT